MRTKQNTRNIYHKQMNNSVKDIKHFNPNQGMLAVFDDDVLRGGNTNRPSLRRAPTRGTDRGPDQVDDRDCTVVRPLLPAQGRRLQLRIKHQGGQDSSVCRKRLVLSNTIRPSELRSCVQ